MAEIITAAYDGGVLRSQEPLELRERQIVRLQILSDSDLEAAQAAVSELVASGVLTPPPGRSDVPPISEQARRELADRLGRAPGKPLSEVIIEDRGER